MEQVAVQPRGAQNGPPAAVFNDRPVATGTKHEGRLRARPQEPADVLRIAQQRDGVHGNAHREDKLHETKVQTELS